MLTQQRKRLKLYFSSLILATVIGTSGMAMAADFGPNHSDPSPGPSSPCNAGNADLTGSYGTDPCDLTRDRKNLSYAQDHQAGWRFVDHVGQWWQDKFLPDLKAMTAQLQGSIIDQTRQMGSLMDAQSVQNVVNLLQSTEIDAKKSMQTNENSCMASTGQLALNQTYKTSNGLTNSFVFGQAARSAGIRLQGDIDRLDRLAKAERAKNGSPLIDSAEAAASTTKVLSPSADLKERFDVFCKYFRDPESNAGNWEGVCPDTSGADEIWDGDIDVENFLLRDTIDMAKPEERAAATAIMQNLLEPRIMERLPDGGTNVDGVLRTPEGQQEVLQKQHISSLRKIASSVVAGIISRRTAIPGTDQVFDVKVETTTPAGGNGNTNGNTTTDPTTDPANTTPGNTTSKGSYADYLKALGKRESDNNYKAENQYRYLGMYQFGEEALQTIGYCKADGKIDNRCTWTGKDGINSKQDFLNNKNGVQDKAIIQFQKVIWQQIRNLGLDRYLGQTINGTVITASGLISGAHLMGAGNLKKFLKSNGSIVPKDGNGVPITHYISLFAGYDTPYGSGWAGASDEAVAAAQANESGGNAPTGGYQTTSSVVSMNVSSTIKDIRTNAGIIAADIAKNPSYNEIMQAMTKERFFDPNYFTRMANDQGAIRQEQTMVDSYIAIQMQDIYRMQEQINMLLAARASMKLNKEQFPDLKRQLPNQ